MSNEMEPRKKVLFVDDETNVLDGLRRMMRPMRSEWDMHFAASGQEALEVLSNGDFDVLVTDMRMPGMGGSELLSIVQKKHPHMVRLVLSGQSEKGQIMQSIGPIHQYLSKPCEPDVLKSALNRSCALRSLFKSREITRAIAQVDSLPSLPAIYLKLMEELALPDATIKNVERIISQDVGMSVKVLQLVNSAFFRGETACRESG